MGAQGAATLDFGAFPGAPSASVDVTGQTGFVSSSLAEAWVYPADDEDMIENLAVVARYQADGTIRVYGEVVPFPQRAEINGNVSGGSMVQEHRLFGTFRVGWVWN